MNNVLVISHHYLTFVKDQVECLAPYFNNISVLVRQNSFKNVVHDCYQMDVKRLPSNVQVYGTPVAYLPYGALYALSGQAHYSSIMKELLRSKHPFDLIHCHFAWSSGFAGALLHEEAKKPLVITAHGYDIYSLPFKNASWEKRIGYALNSADHIITVSRKNLKYIRELNVSTPVTVIPNGYRKDLFYPRNKDVCRRQLGLPLDREIILTVGNLELVKGHEYLIKSIEIMLRDRKDILCILIGSGSRLNALSQQIHRLGLDKVVKLVGGKPHDEIPTWMGASDVVVLPSLNEGNPTVMFEALGCGKAFVGTKVGGVPEIITTKNHGLLVEPGNPHDLAEKILVALDREWSRETILDYAERYAWENIAKEIISVYHQILG